jgi:hypothetical protein
MEAPGLHGSLFFGLTAEYTEGRRIYSYRSIPQPSVYSAGKKYVPNVEEDPNKICG